MASSWPRKACLVSLDLDGLRVLERYHLRAPAGLSPDALFHSGLERFLELFERFRVRATLFIVGQDLEDPSKRALIRQALRMGHEAGNHTYSHPRGFKHLSLEQKRGEILRCHRLIQDSLGVTPSGFRAPEYSLSGDVLELLAAYGYLYDSSVLPCPYYPLIARLIYDRGEEPRPVLDLRRPPNRPYRPSTADIYRPGHAAVWEIPVTCMPLFRLPFHASYVLGSSPWLFQIAEWACRFTSYPLSYLFHLKDASREDFVFGKPQASRLESLGRILGRLARLEVCLAGDYARTLPPPNETRTPAAEPGLSP